MIESVIRDICGSRSGDHEYFWILKYYEFRWFFQSLWTLQVTIQYVASDAT